MGEILSFLSVSLGESWGWVLAGAAVVGIVVWKVYKFLKKLWSKIVALLTIPVGGMLSGGMGTYVTYLDDAKKAGMTVLEYITHVVS